MKINQAIESYTYARISGSNTCLRHIDKIAKKVITSYPLEVQSTLDQIFSEDEYEQKLRYLNEQGKINRKS